MYRGNILLAILPPFWPKMPPIGLGYLQGFLIKNSINTEILDLNNIFYSLSDVKLKKEWLISCDVSLERNMLSIIGNNHPREYRAAIERMLGYNVIGFSCFKSNFYSTLEVVKLIRSKRGDIRIILGGPEITRQFFKGNGRIRAEISKLADFLVIGEGEGPLLNYLKKRNKRKIAKFEQLDNLEDLPFPRYQGLDFGAYPRRDAVPIQFSRGCIRRCNFCSERLLYRGFRARPVKSLIDEISYHKENNKADYFVFFDSLINADLVKLEELCAKMMDNFGVVSWEAQIAIRSDMSQGLLEKMKRSGCYNLFVGLESGSDRMLEKMNKGFTATQAVNFFKRLNQAGLSFGISMIAGYPGESEADFKESLDFIIRNKDIIPKVEQVNPFTYYDGTPADKSGDYKLNKDSLKRMEVFVREIKRHKFKYTNAFLGNLIEKDDRIYAGKDKTNT